MPIFAEGEETQEVGQVQLNLFKKPEQQLLETLRNLDLLNMTPLEALRYLDELHEKAKKI